MRTVYSRSNKGRADVVVIGFGPVGQVLTILLAQRGHRVTVVERWPEVFGKPRAVVFDDEIARVLAVAEIAGRFAEISEPVPDYVWRNAAGQTLLRFALTDRGPSGWPESNMVTQPRLEAALCERAAEFPNVRILRGTEAVDLRRAPHQVEVAVRGPSAGLALLRAAYVVGCDGANSFLRPRMDTTVTDLGFGYDWLICDVVPHEPRTWSPANLQLCDPARPTTMVSGGPGRRRWEFMRMPDDPAAEFDTDATAWRLLAASGITPDNATLEKRALYTFQARWADRWRDDRLLLAGDAAHLMPPFGGQGMCSGIRDAANLAWKLDLVLRGRAAPALLDTYTTERAAHVRHAIQLSVELGRIICETDPEAVAKRDAMLLAAGARPELALPDIPPAALGPGALQSDVDGSPVAPAGRAGVQGRVRTAYSRTALLDDIVGAGFRLLVDGVPELSLSARHISLLDDLEARVVPIVPAGVTPDADSVQDVDDVLLPFLRSAGHRVQIVRPDGYVFGGTETLDALPALLDQLATALR